MRFFGQIKVILYKNFLIRSREKTKIFLLFISTLLFMLILILVDYFGVAKYFTTVEECHSSPKALPSAGFLTFVQSYYCNMNKNCPDRGKPDSDLGSSTDPNYSLFGKLSATVQQLFTDQQVSNNLSSLFQKIEDLAESTGSIPASDSRTDQAFNIPISQILNNKDDFQQKLIGLGMSTSEAQSLLNYQLDRRFYASVIDTFTKADVAGQNFRNFFSLPKPKVDSILQSIKDQAICGDDRRQNQSFCNFNFAQLIGNDMVNIQIASDAFGSAIKSMTGRQFNLEAMLNFTTRIQDILKQDLDSGRPLGKLFGQLISYIGSSQKGWEFMLCNGSSESHNLSSREMSSLPSMDIESNMMSMNGATTQRNLFKRSVQFPDTGKTICGSVIIDTEKPEDNCHQADGLAEALGGFVVFSPDSPPVQRLVAKISKWYSKLLYVKQFVADLSSNTDSFGQAFANSKLAQMFELLIQIYKGLTDELGPIGENGSTLRNLQSIALLFGKSRPSGWGTMKSLLSPAVRFFQCLRTDRFKILPGVDDAKTFVPCLSENRLLLAYIEFQNLTKDSTNFPKWTTYKIRDDFLADKQNPNRIRAKISPTEGQFKDESSMNYYFYGFTILQDLIDRTIIEEQTGKNVSLGVYAQPFPVPCSTNIPPVIGIILTIIPYVITLILCSIYTFIAERIVADKESRLQEYMKVMGLGSGAQFVAFFVEAMLIFLVVFALILPTFYFGNFILKSNYLIFILFLVLVATSITTQAFLISAVFSSASIVSVCSQLAYVLMFVPFVILKDESSTMLKILSGLLAQVSTPYGLYYIIKWETEGTGLQFYNWNRSPEIQDGFNLQMCMILLTVSSILHVVLLWYISNVYTGDYGVSKPWYFFVQPSYWSGGVPLDDTNVINRPPSSDRNVEKPPENVKVGVSLRNLVKQFSGDFLAVDHLTVDFYENQVTSFLGRNGAGKTTTMSIICGMIPQTSGDVVISGKDIRTKMGEIRNSLGLCPQHNILIDLLTVEHHLQFYAALKGLTGHERQQEVDYYLKTLDLIDKRDVASKALSGGMKRRLSLAAAFIGGSRIVILDEPTAGVDPYARRQIWDVILKNKEGRTILMSTHYMDEAEILGDRIAIISAGKLKCAGSSLFLKSLFGSNYYLTLDLNDSFRLTAPRTSISEDDRPTSQQGTSARSITRTQTSLENIKALVVGSVPGSKFKEHLGQSLVFTLPHEDSERLATLFDQLDQPETKLMGVMSYGISETKMEEIFLKTDARKNSINSVTVPVEELNADRSKPDRSNRNFSTWSKFVAVYIKRFHNFRRSLKSAICEIVLPVLLVALAAYASLQATKQPAPSQAPNDPDPMLLSPWLYGSPNYIFSSNSLNKSSANDVLDSMYHSPYTSVGCFKSTGLKNVDCGSTTSVIKSQRTTAETSTAKTSSCYCKKVEGRYSFECPAGADIPKPPKTFLPTGDYLVHATGINVTDWLMATYSEYNYNRYGGFSVGQQQLGNNTVDNIDWSTVPGNVDQVKNSLRNFLQQMNLDQSVVDKLVGSSNSTVTTESMEQLLENSNPQDNIKIWFNSLGRVALPIYTNVLNNAILRANLPTGADPSQYGIVAYSHPMIRPYNNSQHAYFSNASDQQAAVMLVSAAVLFSFALLFASLVSFTVSETATTAKHLQLISGLRSTTYWIANLAWDMTNLCLLVTLLMIVFFIFNIGIFVGTVQQVLGTICLFIMCGYASLPILYWFTFIFRSPSASLIALSIGYIISDSVATSVVQILIIKLADSPQLLSFFEHAFLVLPSYCLYKGMDDLKTAYSTYNSASGYAADNSPFVWHLLSKKLFIMAMTCIAAFLIVLFFENYNWIVFKLKKRKMEILTVNANEDDDVAKERQYIGSSRSKNCAVKVDSLKQNFTPKTCFCIPKFSKTFTAVNRVCFSVQKGECFGLLGVNGAGKTTTLDMITGKIIPTGGDAYVCGYSIFGDKNNARKHLGLCPQFDALNLRLTAREQLTLYARIKGIPKKDIKLVVDNFIQQLDLNDFADRISQNYSGGNKRKLSVAIAMLGNPDVILLDEPVAGMDPKARRFLWNEILRMTRQGSSIILTTHSMEECEALCSRLGIMVQGTFQCIGTPQHLKNKFGGGYSMIIKLAESSSQDVDRFDADLKEQFPEAELKCRYNLQLEYKLPNQPDTRLGSIFRFLTWAKSKYHIEDYSLSQTTLDDVFVSFAAQQHENINNGTGAAN